MDRGIPWLFLPHLSHPKGEFPRRLIRVLLGTRLLENLRNLAIKHLTLSVAHSNVISDATPHNPDRMMRFFTINGQHGPFAGLLTGFDEECAIVKNRVNATAP